MRPLRFGFGLMAVCFALGLLDGQVRAECHHAPIPGGSPAAIPGGRSNLSPLDALRQAVVVSEAAESVPTGPSRAPEVPCLRCTHTPVSTPNPVPPRLDLNDDLMTAGDDGAFDTRCFGPFEEAVARYCSLKQDVPVPPPRPVPNF